MEVKLPGLCLCINNVAVTICVVQSNSLQDLLQTERRRAVQLDKQVAALFQHLQQEQQKKLVHVPAILVNFI